MKRFALFVAFCAVLSAALVGCGSDDSARSGASEAYTEDAGAPPGAAIAPDSGPRERQPAPPQEPQKRKEVVTGKLSLSVGDPIDAGKQAVRIVEELDGHVDSRSEQPGTDTVKPRVSMTVRVPTDKTDQLIEKLRALGRVVNISINRDDVTRQVEDLDAKIKALQASTDRLRGLMTTSTNLKDLLDAERELATRQGQLDGLVAQQRALADQVALSTISMDLTTDADAPKPDDEDPDNFWEGLVAGWNSLVGFLGALVIGIGAALPWLVFLAAVFGAGAWVVYRLVKRASGAGGARPDRTEQQGTAAADS